MTYCLITRLRIQGLISPCALCSFVFLSPSPITTFPSNSGKLSSGRAVYRFPKPGPAKGPSASDQHLPQASSRRRDAFSPVYKLSVQHQKVTVAVDSFHSLLLPLLASGLASLWSKHSRQLEIKTGKSAASPMSNLLVSGEGRNLGRESPGYKLTPPARG